MIFPHMTTFILPHLNESKYSWFNFMSNIYRLFCLTALFPITHKPSGEEGVCSGESTGFGVITLQCDVNMGFTIYIPSDPKCQFLHLKHGNNKGTHPWVGQEG